MGWHFDQPIPAACEGDAKKWAMFAALLCEQLWGVSTLAAVPRVYTSGGDTAVGMHFQKLREMRMPAGQVRWPLRLNTITQWQKGNTPMHWQPLGGTSAGTWEPSWQRRRVQAKGRRRSRRQPTMTCRRRGSSSPVQAAKGLLRSKRNTRRQRQRRRTRHWSAYGHTAHVVSVNKSSKQNIEPRQAPV